MINTLLEVIIESLEAHEEINLISHFHFLISKQPTKEMIMRFG